MTKRSKRKNNKKNGPDHNLVPDQIESLNQEFYTNYFYKYYLLKFILLLTVISKPDLIMELFDKEGNNLELGVLKIGIEKDEFGKEDLLKYSKLELSVTYYHVLETFLRLFLAHAEMKSCPWLELSRKSIHKFKSQLKELSIGKFNFSYQDWSSDEILLYVFYGVKSIDEMPDVPDDVNKEIPLKVLKDWIIWAAKETLEVFDYNAYKHGLAVFAGERGLQYGEHSDIVFKEHGDALKFISKHEKPDRWVWRKSIVFTPLDARAAIINLAQGLISNIIKIGRATYLGEANEHTLLFIGGENAVPSFFYKQVKTNNKYGAMIQSYNIELSYYSNKKDK